MLTRRRSKGCRWAEKNVAFVVVSSVSFCAVCSSAVIDALCFHDSIRTQLVPSQSACSGSPLRGLDARTCSRPIAPDLRLRRLFTMTRVWRHHASPGINSGFPKFLCGFSAVWFSHDRLQPWSELLKADITFIAQIFPGQFDRSSAVFSLTSLQSLHSRLGAPRV